MDAWVVAAALEAAASAATDPYTPPTVATTHPGVTDVDLFTVQVQLLPPTRPEEDEILRSITTFFRNTKDQKVRSPSACDIRLTTTPFSNTPEDTNIGVESTHLRDSLIG